MSEALMRGRHILLVEDEYFFADAMQRELEDIGAHVVGPAASVEDVLALLDSSSIDGAILDVDLDDEGVFAVAEAPTTLGIRFVFTNRLRCFGPSASVAACHAA